MARTSAAKKSKVFDSTDNLQESTYRESDLELIDSSAMSGNAIYSHALLAAYDLYVIGLPNSLAWKCSTNKLLSLYNENISAKHLDIGVGSGFYLDNCQFPASSPQITLGDTNRDHLEKVSQRIARHNPTTVQMNIFDPKTYPFDSFESIGINYLLHCLPGPFKRKLNVFSNLMPYLVKGGRVFGSTILGTGAPHNLLGRLLLKTYNKNKIFSNTEDNVNDLKEALTKIFGNCKVEVEGCVALFSARVI